MNKKIIFILSLLSILSLTLLSNQSNVSGKITTINYYSGRIEINIENVNETIVLFINKKVNISKDDRIQVTGTKSTYKNTNQIIANKIVKINKNI